MLHTVLIILHAAAGLVFFLVLCLPLREVGSWRLRLYTGFLIAMFVLVLAAVTAHWIAST